MFITRPSGHLEAVLDVRTARPVHLQVRMRHPGEATPLEPWSQTGSGRFRVPIPAMNRRGRLRIYLDAFVDEEDDLELDVAFLQDGILLDGSQGFLRKRLADGHVRFTLDYWHLGDGVLAARTRGLMSTPVENFDPPSLPMSPYDQGPASGDFALPHDNTAAALDEAGPQVSETAAPTERRINVWVAEREGDREEPLALDERYTLCINVGFPVAGSLVEDAEAVVPDQDIPENGLPTEWVIQSSDAELEPVSKGVTVTRHEADRVAAWTARFLLHVPRGVDSATIRMACIPRVEGVTSLQVLVYARNPARPGRAELYRELEVSLNVAQPAAAHRREGAAAPPEAVRVAGEVLHSPAGHLNLHTRHEWTSPRNQVSVTVLSSGMALVQGDLGSRQLDEEVRWEVSPVQVHGLIANVRAALERFRAKHEGYLNAIEPDDLERRLPRTSGRAHASFFGCGPQPSKESLEAWKTVLRSPELTDLAVEGRTLYDTFFPQGSELRGWIDEMDLHDRLDLNLQPRAHAMYLPHVPWGLMYRNEPPTPGDKVNPMGFLGLALRLGYSAHKNPVPSKALGRVESVNRAFLLYWGDQPTDPTGVEARWQHKRWAGQPNHVVVPNDSDAGTRKRRLVDLLHAPEPSPVRLLYLYCQCKAEGGNRPELRFANDTQPDNLVRHTELGTALLEERPLVFANACTTAAADVSMLNELEASFFRRGARAYIGTESKVPITLASRFAHVFFHYFDRRASSRPIAAGEAVYQARHFLWSHYRNLGGLFYTYVNQFELYMADDAEVRSLQS